MRDVDDAVKGVPLRRRLLLLAAAGMVPIALMSGVALFAIFQQQRDQAGRAGLEVSRALSLALDAEVQRTFSVLQALANSPALGADDIEGFSRALARTMPTQPSWRAVILADDAGMPLVNTGVTGSPPPLVEPESFMRSVREKKPVVGFAAPGPRGTWAVPVRVPVMRGGEGRCATCSPRH